MSEVRFKKPLGLLHGNGHRTRSVPAQAILFVIASWVSSGLTAAVANILEDGWCLGAGRLKNIIGLCLTAFFDSVRRIDI